MTSCEGKNSWPELVGVQGTVAEATIERENPSVDAIIVEDGSVVTPDFRCDRVWLMAMFLDFVQISYTACLFEE
uniref:Uncharacterized protein n=1 Tax=Quercus lobata TaxID=97700 RepID=A0A7N2R6A2_QUELO